MKEGSAYKKVKVRFEPDNVSIVVERGANLLQAAIDAGVRVIASCGGTGVCGTCKVRIESGDVESSRSEKLSPQEWRQGIRQACRSRVLTDLIVTVPVESRLETAVVNREAKITGGSVDPAEAIATGWRFSPPLSKCYLELPPPTSADNTSDLSRLLRGLKKQCGLNHTVVALDVVKKLPSVLRKKDCRVTVTTLVKAVKTKADKREPAIINIEPGNTSQRHFALAFDIGTTTVCGQLLDLNRGEVIAEGVAYNGQVDYGADVITRISYCLKPGGLKKLQRAAVATINQIIDDLLFRSQVRVEDIGHVTIAGNTTMTHILLGINPKYIRLAPYTPAASFFPPVTARSLGINAAKHVHVFVFPSVASYVGGDIVSGVVAVGMHQRERLTLYMDIGTNGEIVVGNSEWMVTAACSAGPAFEGGGIKHGMIATTGAIEEFAISLPDLEPEIHTIGGVKPKGICGSGLLNIVAGLLEAGVIGRNGKFNTDLVTNRIRKGSDGYEYVLSWGVETQTGRDIVITEVDIDNLIRAKAAMYAGCQTLTGSVGITCADLEQIIIAGAFGSHIDIEKSITIGLLPDVPRNRFIFVGNGSLSGSRLVSYSTDLLDDARRVAMMMTGFELGESPDFMHHYVAALFLPHTNAAEFPNVSKRMSGLAGGKAKGRLAV
ncbi:MAG: ASKHA domain-containing protein [Dehalococcoidales bacterium]|nr:ASKHA domain-containing protein [Dehalococcoidales bacterium]